MKLKLMIAALAAAFAGRTGMIVGALSLTLEKAEHAKLPKDQQSMYVEKDGKYHLDIEVEDTQGLKSALEKEREARKTAEKAAKDLAKKFEGLDADELRKLLEKLGGDEEAQLIKAGKIDEVVTRRMEKANKAHAKAVEELQKEVEAANGRTSKYSQRVLDNAVREAATKAGLHANAVDDALFRARTMFSLNEEGVVVQLKDNEVVMGKDGKTPFSPGEWLESMKDTAPHWFPSSGTGGGAPGGGKGVGGKTIKRAAFDQLTPEARAQTVKDKVQIVD